MATPGFSIGASIPNLPIPGQTFRNIPKPNFQPAIYALAIRQPQPPYAVIQGYTFPLSPRNIRKEYAAMTNFYDVNGDPSQRGVQRIIDRWGSTPVIYTIAGTTGWQFHGTDGYLLSGTASIIALENLLALYDQLNEIQIQNGIADLYILEFYDYFKGEFWEVVPFGPQGYQQDERQPLLIYYRYKLAGVRELSGPAIVQTVDQIALAFEITQSQAAQNLNIDLLSVATYYSGVTYTLAGP